MAASTIVKHLYDGVITLKDGTGTPVTLVVPFTVGDLSLTGVQETQRDVTAYQARGVKTSVRHTTRNFVTGSFSFQVADYSDGTDQTAIDFMLKQGSYSGNVSTESTGGAEVYTIDLDLDVEGTDLGDSADHAIGLTDIHCVLNPSEGEPNTVSVDFTVYGDVTFT
jgi:hypothetical protein